MTARADNEPRTIDARGLKCPWPVLRAERIMRECDDLMLVADDPVALTDVPALARARGWSVETTSEPGCTRFHIRKCK